MEKWYTQPEAATILGFKHYRSLNKLITKGDLECVKRKGRCGRKIFSEKHLQDYLNSKMV
jgi:hypothetical protein